jgi:hypothetical protein
VIEKIKQGIEKYRGIFKIKMEPKVVTDVDDETLKVKLIKEFIRIRNLFVGSYATS